MAVKSPQKGRSRRKRKAPKSQKIDRKGQKVKRMSNSARAAKRKSGVKRKVVEEPVKVEEPEPVEEEWEDEWDEEVSELSGSQEDNEGVEKKAKIESPSQQPESDDFIPKFLPKEDKEAVDLLVRLSEQLGAKMREFDEQMVRAMIRIESLKRHHASPSAAD